MSWSVFVTKKSFTYSLAPQKAEEVEAEEEENDESWREVFYGYVDDGKHKFHQEDSCEYQTPPDDVLISVFCADTEHGHFEWEVRSVRHGFESFAKFDSSYLVEFPPGVEMIDDPEFDIIQDGIDGMDSFL